MLIPLPFPFLQFTQTEGALDAIISWGTTGQEVKVGWRTLLESEGGSRTLIGRQWLGFVFPLCLVILVLRLISALCYFPRYLASTLGQAESVRLLASSKNCSNLAADL